MSQPEEVYRETDEGESSGGGRTVQLGHWLDGDGVHGTCGFGAGALRIDRRNVDGRDRGRGAQSRRDREEHIDRPVAQATANETGYYSIPNLLEGVYDLSVTAPGFSPYTQKGVTVSINRVTRVDAAIELGAVTEQVSVEASTALLQTTKSDVSASSIRKAIENLPLSGYRNFQSLINLVPGATPARYPERRHGYAGTSVVNQRQWPGAWRQQYPRGRIRRHPRHDAPPRGVRRRRSRASRKSTSPPTTSMPSRA